MLDRCTDATEERARGGGADLTLHVIHAAGAGVGHARRTGMDLAARAAAAGRADRDHGRGLDARAGLAEHAARRGRRRRAGDRRADRARRATTCRPPRSPAARATRPAATRQLRGGGAREHHQFSGASLAVTAATYARSGRLEPREALEDEGFERALHRHGVPIERLAAVRVTTSGAATAARRAGSRSTCAATAGSPSAATTPTEFPLDALLARKHADDQRDPPHARCRGHAPANPRRDRDARSADRRAARRRRAARATAPSSIARARGVRLLAQPQPGKGDAMWRGLAATTGELVAFLDTDTEDFTDAFVRGLLGPLLTAPRRLRQGPLPAPAEGRRHDPPRRRRPRHRAARAPVPEPALPGAGRLPAAARGRGRGHARAARDAPVPRRLRRRDRDADRRRTRAVGLERMAQVDLGSAPEPPPAAARPLADGARGARRRRAPHARRDAVPGPSARPDRRRLRGPRAAHRGAAASVAQLTQRASRS